MPDLNLNLLDVFAAAVVLGATEAIIKPITVVLTQWALPRGTAQVLLLADRLIPQLLDDGKTGADLELQLRQAAVALTGDPAWEKCNLAPIWRRFDPRILLDRNG